MHYISLQIKIHSPLRAYSDGLLTAVVALEVGERIAACNNASTLVV